MKLFLGSIAIASLIAGSAMAADMAVKTPVYKAPTPVAAYSWTGCYVGGNVGGAWGRSDVTYTQTGAYPPLAEPADVVFANNLGSPRLRNSGFTIGGQTGCNYQMSSLVIGLETDLNWVGVKNNYFAAGTIPVGGGGVSSTVSVESNYLFTLRPRAGIAVDRALFYVTGGLAVGNEKFSQSFSHFFVNTPTSSESGSISKSKVGWTVGGGIEYAVTNNWSAKIEYLHVDLGSVNFNAANNLFPIFTASNSVYIREDIVRVGLNYKFGSGPVVANY